jgi:uncharacterized membrane protein
MAKGFFNKARNYFITGLAVVLPAFLTLIVLKWFVLAINSALLHPIVRFMEPHIGSKVTLFLANITLFCLIVLFIMFCGFATRILLMHKFFGWWEKVLKGTPLINKIYGAAKELSAAFFRGNKGLFSRVVVIEYPRPGLFAIGFVTAEAVNPSAVKKDTGGPLVSVYVPTTPNPATGVFVFVKKSELIASDLTVEDAMKLIISGGAIAPPQNEADLNDTED